MRATKSLNWAGMLLLLAPFFSLAAIAAPSYNPKSGDPCTVNMRKVVPINQTANAQLLTGAAGKYTYICSIHLDGGTPAQNIALVEGTGSTCGTSTAGMAGGATAATGWNLGADQFITLGDGLAWVLATATAGNNVCLLQSAGAQVSGAIQYVQQ